MILEIYIKLNTQNFGITQKKRKKLKESKFIPEQFGDNCCFVILSCRSKSLELELSTGFFLITQGGPEKSTPFGST